MVTRKLNKIWLGIGAAALLSSGPASPTDAAEPSVTKQPSAQQQGAAPAAEGAHAGHMQTAPAPATTAVQGGESGEGGDATGLDPRVKFFRDMSLIRGHLLVGDELVKAGLWEDALPHFHHPVEELYTSIGPRLQGQGLRQFDTTLKALAQTVQAKNRTAYDAALRVVVQRMADTDKGMRKFATPFLQSRVSTVLAVLRSATSEYAEAVEDGRITKPVEYQDSRGFVFYAERLLNSIAPDLEKKDKAALAAIRAAYADLKTTWPTPVPPEKAIRDHDAVVAAVARVESAADPFLKK